MAENSKIQWTDHTANFWWGCTKVHAGCANCYAESTDKRYGGKHWGKKATRRSIVSVWNDLAKWNEAAGIAGEIHNVFACSMCDLFEDFTGDVVDSKGHVLAGHSIERLRQRALFIMPHLEHLRFLVLTKRPENIIQMVPVSWLEIWPKNVWTGTSPCNQETADQCIQHLIRVPGSHFLSCEPLLGPINLHRVKDRCGFIDAFDGRGHDGSEEGAYYKDDSSVGSIDWVIIGGESVGGRECRIEWIRGLVFQCKNTSTAVFVKQLGSNPHETVKLKLKGKGDDLSEYPEDLRIRQFPASFSKKN